MKKLVATLAVMAVLAAVAITAATGAASSGPESVSPAATKTVRVVDDAFRSGSARVRRRRTSVNRGDVIRFVWTNTSNDHNVRGIKGHRFVKPPASSDNPFPSEPGTTVSKRFRRDTTIVCDVHRSTGMRLRVNVR